MKTVATLGPQHSHAHLAACRYAPAAGIKLYPHTSALVEGFAKGESDLAVIPIYNTREGENKEYFRRIERLSVAFWIDNLVVPDHLSLGVLAPDILPEQLRVLLGKRAVFRQCEEYLSNTFPDIALMSVQDIGGAIAEARRLQLTERGVIDTEELLSAQGLHILQREVAPNNRTRYAVLGRQLASPTGYDATALITRPLDDRVGLLVDILGEFSRRGINLLDLRAENDVKTQKLQIYVEIEGHVSEPAVREALVHIEKNILQQPGAIHRLGSFPRLEMRTKHIQSIGFIGTGAMSEWFVRPLKNEGYEIELSGRSTELRPEEMIKRVDVVMICVPISATVETIRLYGPLLDSGKALILLAGESENTLAAALESTSPGVEVMLVHNLWGPQAATMKDKNAIVVRTGRSGKLCSEFEAFLYKHGANIYHDSATRHDLLMGVGQKLPTVMSVALAMTLKDHGITSDDIASHCTLTSLYPILAMARVHSQNPRTYAEIMATSGDSRKIVHDFVVNLRKVIALAEQAQIGQLSGLIDSNSTYLTREFLEARMTQAKAVDEVLGRII